MAPGTIDALFCRDLVAEQVTPAHFVTVPDAVTEPTTDKIIKSMITFELHGLMDCAVELAEHFRPLLSHRFDVDTAIAQLMHRPPNARNTDDVRECLRMIGELRRSSARSTDDVQECLRMIGELHRSSARNADDAQECLRMIGELHRSSARNADDAQERLRMIGELRRMEHSMSWRITAPLRAAKRILTSRRWR